MHTQVWRPFPGVAFGQLHDARIQAHYAVQWLARTARGFIPPLPEDRHTNLGWEEEFDGFTTRPVQGNKRVGLRIPDLSLAILEPDSSKPSHTFMLGGRNDMAASEWLCDQLRGWGLQTSALDAPIPYDLPASHIQNQGCYAGIALAEPLRELTAWYSNAVTSLCAARARLIEHGLQPPEVGGWPHHFDLDSLVTVTMERDGNSRTMGLGFSPGDDYYDEPYFYVSLYPRVDVAALPSLPPLGHWHTRDFMAALAPARRIIAAENPQRETDAFLRAAMEGIITVSTGKHANLG